MKPVSGKRFCKILENHGWELDHVKGSHHVYKRAGDPFNISVPVHTNRDLKTGMQKGLMRQAGVTDADL